MTIEAEPHLVPKNAKFGEVLETRRWFILVAFSLYYICCAIGWLTFNATPEPTKEYFNIDDNQLLYFTDVSLYMGFVPLVPGLLDCL